MILKQLILSGFKSFCDQTEFEFHDGVTCIVGPNGCGKSNVVDAIKWVLGEQSAKSLRGQHMTDMIFGGSSTRKSSGFAQVDLIFDNSDRTLDMDQPEINIGRRLYRSGESEYLLNNEVCRLKDIRELLFDTGIGVDAYSVIEQGRVDAVLQSNPSERRLIFDEAAGISKYKAKRKEAERKLERTQQNLLRAQDIIDELEKRLRSVKLQAGKARRFKELDARLRELRSRYAMSEYHRLTAEKNKLESESSHCVDQRIQLQAELSTTDAQNTDLETQILSVDQDIDRSSHQTAELRSQMTALTERVHSNTQRIAEQQELLAASQKRSQAENERIRQLEASLATEHDKLPALEQRYVAHSKAVGELSEKERHVVRQLTELQASLEDEKSGIIDLLQQSANVNNEIMGLDKHRESLRHQKNRLLQRHGQLGEQMEHALERKAVAQQRLSEVEELLARESHRLDEKQRAYEAVAKKHHQLSEHLAHLKAELSGLESQHELLADLEQKMEGVDAVVQALLQRRTTEPENLQLQAILGTVADLFAAPVEQLVPVEAALEPWAQHVVVDSSVQLLALYRELAELRGRLHAICLDRLPPIISGKDFSGAEGFVAHALDVVTFPDSVERLARQLLGKTVIVKNIHAALALADTDSHGHRFITLAGEVVDNDGRLVVGPQSERTGAISRKTHLREISEKMVTVNQSICELGDELNRAVAEREHLEKLLRNLQQALSDSHTARAEVQAELQHANAAVNQLTKEQPLISGEVQIIEEQLSAAVDQAQKGQQSLSDLKTQNERREETIAKYQQQIGALNAQRNELLEQLTETRVEAGKIAEKKAALQTTLYSLNNALDSARQTLSDNSDQVAQCETRIAESRQAIEESQQQLTELDRTLENHEQDALDLRHTREKLRHSKEVVAEQAKKLRGRLEEVEGLLHDLQVKAHEVVVRSEELSARIQDELGIDLATAYSSYEHEQQDWAVVEEEIKDLREKISRLGNINLDAITEQDELEERLGFLDNQKSDLEQSRAQLQELIDRLNTESRERFLKTFEEIRAYFQEMFRKLFGGGKADLVIDANCDDVLEAGIEVLARPPGKELQNIGLMSGGEKTMTAIALLMSILKTRPSPFVLLDEVDAALDEANNERFNRVVGEFLDDSQFIIITHSKRTMHIADALYGVTMQEPGVSRRVSVHFDENTSTAVA